METVRLLGARAPQSLNSKPEITAVSKTNPDGSRAYGGTKGSRASVRFFQFHKPERAVAAQEGDPMYRWKMMGPSGPMETTAATETKAWANLRYRLVTECGMSWYRAREYDHHDLKRVD